MTQESTTAAIKAVKGLEEKGRKLSEVVNELEKLSSKLGNLDDSIQNVNKAVAAADDELELLNSKTGQIKDELTAELRLRIAESSAEQISRVKDANERLLKLEEQIKSNIDGIKTLGDSVQRDAKSIKFLLFVILVAACAGIANSLGYI
jgi:archaellum component FlaC